MVVNIRFVVAVFPLPLILGCQDKNQNCRIAKKGTFYFYPSKTNRQYRIIRTDSSQTEINLATGDSSFWIIKWKNECTFTLSFGRNTRVMSDEERNFYNSHFLKSKKLTVAPSYYIFKATTDPRDGFKPMADTVWLQENLKTPAK